CELSTIDTALLMAGVLFAREYYDRADPAERAIRRLADDLYRRVDWRWATGGDAPLVRMAWYPERGFAREQWRGYNGAVILYLLALGSPTHPLPGDAWRRWATSYRPTARAGPPYIAFGPLFGHQYSHVWVDFRGLRDPALASLGIDYFENSRRATLAQQA